MGTVTTLALFEAKVHIRNRWVLVFALVFGCTAVAIAAFGLVTAGVAGFQGFARTTASLLNLALYVIPLVSLMMGTMSFAGEKHASELLFVQPIAREHIVWGKLLGLWLAIAMATGFGFGVAGMIIAVRMGGAGVTRYVLFVGLASLLALAFLALGILVAIAGGRKPRAFGYALFLWFFFVLFYDLLAIGLTFLLPEPIANRFVFLSLFGNPVDLVRVSGFMMLDSPAIFGAAGVMLVKFFGGEGRAHAAVLVGTILWGILPAWLAQRLLRRQDI
jgi:Cu-processing system permease protein